MYPCTHIGCAQRNGDLATTLESGADACSAFFYAYAQSVALDDQRAAVPVEPTCMFPVCP